MNEQPKIDCSKFHGKCGASCCSVFPIPKNLYVSHASKIVETVSKTIDFDENIAPVTQSGRCCFLNKDLSCNIYEDRPDICRKFGNESHIMLSCSVATKEGNPRTRQDSRRIQRDLLKKIDLMRNYYERNNKNDRND